MADMRNKTNSTTGPVHTMLGIQTFKLLVGAKQAGGRVWFRVWDSLVLPVT